MRPDTAEQPAAGAGPASVHRLGQDDVALLRAMLALFGAAFDEPDTYGARQPDDGYLRRLLASDGFVAMAALGADGRVVGALAGYVLQKFEQARSELYLYDLAVGAGHRRRGVATALIAALKRFARERGIGVVFVQADRGDHAAVALYTKLGTGADVMHFDIAVDDPTNG